MTGVLRSRRGVWLAALAACVFAAGCASVTKAKDAAPLYQWTQLGEGGRVSLRAIVPGGTGCPQVRIDGRERTLELRAAPGGRERGAGDTANPAFDPPFAVGSCELALPAGAGEASIGDSPVALPRAPVRRIVVVGDTGCRIKVPAKGAADPIQNCMDPAAWPWERLAATAARLRPDLVIHVGDYHYREYCDDPRRCADLHARTTIGYGWEGWEADFFAPASPLLAAAPWVFVRGNHENCDRAGAGWMRFLSPLPYRPCPDQRHHGPGRSVLANNLTEPAFVVDVDGGLGLVVVDNAGHDDGRAADASPQDAARFRADLAVLGALPPDRKYLFLSHRPIWYDLLAPAAQPNALQAALRRKLPGQVRFALGGHLHLFEVINFVRDADPDHHPGGRPAQVIVGGSGTQLDALDPESPYYEGGSGPGSRERLNLAGQRYEGVAAASGLRLNRYSFLILDRQADGWAGALLDPDGRQIASCRLHDERKEMACAPGEGAAAPAPRSSGR